MRENRSHPEPRPDWMALSVLTVLTGFGYVFLEWLFIATKPSFMSSMSWPGRFRLLLETAVPLMAVGVVVGLVAAVLTRVVRLGWAERLSAGFLALLPALMVAVLGSLLVDNFTLTVFDFGIRNVTGSLAWLYAALFLALLVAAHQTIWHVVRGPSLWSTPPVVVATSLLLIGAVVTTLSSTWEGAAPRDDVIAKQDKTSWPNIIIFGSDGVAAAHTSLYGYYRETTPFLKELGQQSLVCENAFSNASHTGASLVSMLAGKLPTETRLIYPPDILHGRDAYQHLPGILRQLGYHSIQISMRHYADVFDLNMRHSFDEVNSRSLEERGVSPRIIGWFGQEAGFLLETLTDRVESRVLHLTGVRPMIDVFAEVAKAQTRVSQRDQVRMKELLDFIDRTKEPFFAQVHLLATHPGGHHPRQRTFSHPGEDPKSDDAYDDCILESDGRLKEVVEDLRSRGLYDRTVLVVYSDHGPRFATNLRVPLVFHFPSGERSGRIRENVQLTDVAPTLLDYLGLEQPTWMSGRSLLQGAPDRLRPIFSAFRLLGSEVKEDGLWRISSARLSPPFFSLGRVTVVICNEWYTLDLGTGQGVGGRIEHYSAPCAPDELPGSEKERAIIVDHLRAHGYDVRSLLPAKTSR